MKVIATIAELRAALKADRLKGKSIGLVPTMGYLHIGHMSLVRHSKNACDVTVVSIFVNPTQFGPNEDLSSYPRDMAGDLAKLEAEGVDYVFTPDVAEIYRQGANTIVDNPVLSRILIGKIRPGHFRGVTTVVTKLFNIVQPDHAFFGEKDYQQLTIVRRMVADLDMPIEITGVATVREDDGLACSSRNAMLTACRPQGCCHPGEITGAGGGIGRTRPALRIGHPQCGSRSSGNREARRDRIRRYSRCADA